MMDSKKLKRDNHSRAVLNTDTASFKQYRYDVMKSRSMDNTLKDVENLKNDVNEIKEMLRLLLNGNKNG